MKLLMYSYLVSNLLIVTCFAQEAFNPMSGSMPGLPMGGVGSQKFDPSVAAAAQAAEHKSFDQIMSQVSPEERTMMEQMLAMFPPGEGEQLIEELFNMPPEQLTELVTQANQVLQEQNIDINQIEQALAEGNWPPPELMQSYEPEPYMPSEPTLPPAYTQKQPERIVQEVTSANQDKIAAQKLKLIGQEIVRSLQSLQIKGLEEESISKKLQPHQLHIADIIFYIETLIHPGVLQHLKAEDIELFSKKLEKFNEQLSRYEPQIVITKAATADFFDPYIMLGISPAATSEQIEDRYQELRDEKDPEVLRTTTKLSERELAKARSRFKPIKKAYSMISDAQSRAEYDRIIKARALNNNRLESAAQRALAQVIQALEEAFLITDINAQAQTLAKTYNATAVEERKKQLALEEATSKRIEDYRKERQAPATPLPGSGGFGGFGDGGYPGLGAGYGGGSGYTPPTPNFPTNPQAPAGGGDKSSTPPHNVALPEKKDDKEKKKKSDKKQPLRSKARKKSDVGQQPLGKLKEHIKSIDKPEFVKEANDLYVYLRSNDTATIKDDKILAAELKKLEDDVNVSNLNELIEQFNNAIKDKPEPVKIKAQKKWRVIQEEYKGIIEPLFKLITMPKSEVSPLKQFLHYNIADALSQQDITALNITIGNSFKLFQEKYKPMAQLLEELSLVDVRVVVKQFAGVLQAIDKTELKNKLSALHDYLTDGSPVQNNDNFNAQLQAILDAIDIQTMYEYYAAIRQSIPLAPNAQVLQEAEQQLRALEKKHKELFDKIAVLRDLNLDDISAQKRFLHAGDTTALTDQEQAQLGMPSGDSFIRFQELLGEFEQQRQAARFPSATELQAMQKMQQQQAAVRAQQKQQKKARVQQQQANATSAKAA